MCPVSLKIEQTLPVDSLNLTPDFYRQKFEARVPSLEVNISDKRLLLLMSFLRNFPVPASTSMVTIGDDVVDGIGPAIAPLFAFVSLYLQKCPCFTFS